MPGFLRLTMAYRPIDKPTKMPTLKFPRRAIFPGIHRALFYRPTWLLLLFPSRLLGEEKQHLSFDMHGNLPPPLLEALYGFEGGAKQFRHLALSFSQLASNI